MRNWLDAARAWAFTLADPPTRTAIPSTSSSRAYRTVTCPALRGGHVDTDQTAHNQHRPRGRTSPVDRGARRVVGAFPSDRSLATTSGGSLPRKLRARASSTSRSVTIHRPDGRKARTSITSSRQSSPDHARGQQVNTPAAPGPHGRCRRSPHEHRTPRSGQLAGCLTSISQPSRSADLAATPTSDRHAARLLCLGGTILPSMSG
jgi:hypothetical protein